jgi:hypothetical protein
MRRSFAVFTRALGDVWHGKKNVAKRMLKFFAKGEKSAGTALTRMLLSVHAHAVIKRVRVSEAFAIKLVERLDELLRARHISRFATFVDAIEKAEAGDDFDILGLRKDVLHRSACEGQVRRFLGVLAQGRSRAAFARLREQLGAGSNPPAVHADALAAGTTEATLLVALNGARERLAADAGGAEQVAAAGDVDANLRNEDARFAPLCSLIDLDMKASMKTELEALVANHHAWIMVRQPRKKRPDWLPRDFSRGPSGGGGDGGSDRGNGGCGSGGSCSCSGGG